jgi:hypothetical protein
MAKAGKIRAILSILTVAAVAMWVTLGYAQDSADQAGANGSANTGDAASNGQEADDAEQSSEEVMQQLLEQREDRQVRPTDDAGDGAGRDTEKESVDMPAAGVEADTSVLGIAPGSGEASPTLHREGEVIVNRRGRLARAKDSNRLMFVFDSDKKASPEAPMILQACRTLETMEKIVRKRGESVPFIISGQVHTYRNQNYLMPTMMKIAEDRGNLK